MQIGAHWCSRKDTHNGMRTWSSQCILDRTRLPIATTLSQAILEVPVIHPLSTPHPQPPVWATPSKLEQSVSNAGQGLQALRPSTLFKIKSKHLSIPTMPFASCSSISPALRSLPQPPYSSTRMQTSPRGVRDFCCLGHRYIPSA